MEIVSPSYISLSYISSESTNISGLSLRISAMARISSFSNIPPVGFPGLFIIISFVFGVIRLLSFSTSGLKSLSAVNGIGTGMPLANLIQLSYIGNPGLG